MVKKKNKKKENKYTVTLVLPKNRDILSKKYAEVLAKIVAEELTHEELGELIKHLEAQEKQKN